MKGNKNEIVSNIDKIKETIDKLKVEIKLQHRQLKIEEEKIKTIEDLEDVGLPSRLDFWEEQEELLREEEMINKLKKKWENIKEETAINEERIDEIGKEIKE